MHASTTFDVTVSAERVVAYLTTPRHLIWSNHKGPIIERSDGPLAVGSWFVLSFGQLRARVEFTALDFRTVSVTVSWTGRGAWGGRQAYRFDLSELDGGMATRVNASVESDGGLMTWEPLMRVEQSLSWRRLRKQIEANA